MKSQKSKFPPAANPPIRFLSLWLLRLALGLCCLFSGSAALAIPLGPAFQFELHGNGFYWAQKVQHPRIELLQTLNHYYSESGVVRYRRLPAGALESGWLTCGELKAAFAGSPSPNIRPVLENSDSLAARDGGWLYSIQDGTLRRKPLFNANPNVEGETLKSLIGLDINATHAFAVRQGSLYFANGRVLRSLNATDGTLRDVVTVPVGQDIVECVLAADGSFLVRTSANNLYYRRPFVDAQDNPFLVATNVVTWSVRMERPTPVLPEFPTIYAVSTPWPSTVYAYDTYNGSRALTTTGYQNDSVIEALTLDENRIFTIANYLGGGNPPSRNRSVFRMDWPRDVALRSPSATWSTRQIEVGHGAGGAGNLRTDGKWLYWIRGGQLHYDDADAPEARCDLQATRMEVVQVIQDLNNSIPLISGRRAFVRAYGDIAEATIPFNTSSLIQEGVLEVFRGGVRVTSISSSEKEKPSLVIGADLGVQRSTRDGGYLFEVPGEHVLPDTTYRFTLNPRRSLPETASAPSANNVISVKPQVRTKVPTLLYFHELECAEGRYDAVAQVTQTTTTVARAESLLPVSRIVWRKLNSTLRKPKVKFCSVFGVIPYPCLSDETFDFPDDKNWALLWSTVAHSRDVIALAAGLPNDGDIHWVAVAPSQANEFNGIAGLAGRSVADMLSVIDPHGLIFGTLAFLTGNPLTLLAYVPLPKNPYGRTSVVKMGVAGSAGPNAWDTDQSGYTLAHELGHNYGNFHIQGNCGGASAPDFPFDTLPYPQCQFTHSNLASPSTVLGFDSINRNVVVPQPPGAPVADLMAYSRSQWPSRETYMRTMDAIPDASSAGLAQAPRAPRNAVLGSAVLLQATIDETFRAAHIQTCVTLPPGTFSPERLAETSAMTSALTNHWPLRVRLLDAARNILTDTPVMIHGEAEDGGTFQIVHSANCPTGTGIVQIVAMDQVIAEHIFSATAPVLGTPIVALTGDALSVTWEASDPDNDPLEFIVQYSHSEGVWQNLSSAQYELSLAISSHNLPAGNACKIRVIASDGGNSTIAESASFVVFPHAPTTAIAGIRHGEIIPYGESRTARAACYDADEFLADTAFAWTLTDVVRGQNTTGTGSGFSLLRLPPGAWSLSLTATDSTGLAAMATVEFHVQGPQLPELLEKVPSIDGLCLEPEWGVAARFPITRSIAGELRSSELRLVRIGGQLYGCATDLHRGFQPTFLLSLNLDPTTNGRDFQMIVHPDGTVEQKTGNLPGVSADPTPDGGVVCAVVQSDTTWSLEFCIPDRVLGGWAGTPGLTWMELAGGAVNGSWPAGLTHTSPSANFSTIGFGALPGTPNYPPVAIVEPDRALTVEPGEIVHISAEGSKDPDDPFTISWEQLSGPPLAVVTPGGEIHAVRAPLVATPTVFRFRATVMGGGGQSAMATATLTFSPARGQELAPAAFAQISPTSGSTGLRLAWPNGTGNTKTVMLQSSADLHNWEDLRHFQTDFFSTVVAADTRPVPPEGRRFYRLRESPITPTVRAGNALRFSAGNCSVTVNHTPVLNSYPLTASAWVLTSSANTNYSGILTKYLGFNGWSLHLHQGRLRAWYFGDANNYIWNPQQGGDGIDGGFIADGFWHHVALIVDHAGGRLYVDGELGGSLPWTGTARTATSVVPLLLGEYPGASSFPGDMDAPALWSRALDQAELVSTIHVSPGVSSQNLISLWHADEQQGPAVRSATSPGLDGTISGAVNRPVSTAPIWRP